jgi:hypothetical protein
MHFLASHLVEIATVTFTPTLWDRPINLGEVSLILQDIRSNFQAYGRHPTNGVLISLIATYLIFGNKFSFGALEGTRDHTG